MPQKSPRPRAAKERNSRRPAPSAQVSKTRARTSTRAAPQRRSRTGAAGSDRRVPFQERARHTVDAVVEAAGELLVAEGYERASTNAIAKRAGISIGSLYQYFDGKEAVFRALLQRHHDQVAPLVRRTLERMAEPNEDLVEVIEALLRELVALHEQAPELMRAIDTQLGSLEHGKDAHDASQHGVTVTARILAERGDLEPTRAQEHAWLLVHVISYVSRLLAHSAPRDLDREVLITGVSGMARALMGKSPPRARGRRHSR